MQKQGVCQGFKEEEAEGWPGGMNTAGPDVGRDADLGQDGVGAARESRRVADGPELKTLCSQRRGCGFNPWSGS